MMKFCSVAALGATLLTGTAASAQWVDPGLSRDLGRAVGQAAVAAEHAAAEARVAASEAMRAARQGYDEAGGRYARQPAMASSEDQAIDACAQAAEQRGYDQGFRAVVRDIRGVNRTPGGWDVDGEVEARRGWRDRPQDWGFRCSVRDGRVVNVDLGVEYARR